MGILSRSICLSCTDKKKEKKFGDSGVGALFQGRLAIYHLRHCANHPQPNLNNSFNILTSIKQNKNNYCSKTKFWNSLFFYTFQTDWEHLFQAKHLEPLPKCVVASFNFHLYCHRAWGTECDTSRTIRRVSNSARVEGLGGEGVPIHTRSYTVLCAHFSLIILNICMNQGDR